MWPTLLTASRSLTRTCPHLTLTLTLPLTLTLTLTLTLPLTLTLTLTRLRPPTQLAAFLALAASVSQLTGRSSVGQLSRGTSQLSSDGAEVG